MTTPTDKLFAEAKSIRLPGVIHKVSVNCEVVDAPAKVDALFRTVAIIGTAGRDKKIDMTKATWEFMCEQTRQLVKPTDHLVSGGAAWADHLVVWAYLEGLCESLTLHLPAVLNGDAYDGDFGTSGGAANYYHKLFSKVIGRNTIGEVQAAIDKGATVTNQATAAGYVAMAKRNKLVADQCDHMIAFTFGMGDIPADGGTKMTWDMAGANKHRQHVPLPLPH